MTNDEFSTVELGLPQRRHRRGPFLVGFMVILLVLAGAGAYFIGPGEADLFDPVVETPVELAPTILGAQPIALEEIPDPLPDQVPLDDQDQTAMDKCQMVRPKTVSLIGTTGSITIHNCGAATVDWTAHATKFWAELAETVGTLAPGASHKLTFKVKTASLPDGPYTFKIRVIQAGTQEVAEISGRKLGLAAPQPSPSIGGITTGGPTGCAAKCITKAWLTPNVGTANLSLEVKTTTLARIGVAVDPAAPKHKPSGEPYFTSADVQADSGIERTRWTTLVKPLKPQTTYHIIVAARDGQGATSYQTGTFRTVKVIDDVANAVPGGCSANCVKSATLTPIAGKARANIQVETYVPVKMAVFVDDKAAADSGAQWAQELDLEHDTTYEIRLQLTDQQGNRQTHQADVTTPPAPAANHQNNVVVRIAKIFVSNDADNSTLNWRGELQFRVDINGEPQLSLYEGERKVHAPETLDIQRTTVVNNSPDVLFMRVQGWERDGGGGTGFCSEGQPVRPEMSGRVDIDDCGEYEWNTAELAIDLHASQGGGALPACGDFGATGDICLAFDSKPGHAPGFVVMVAVTFVD